MIHQVVFDTAEILYRKGVRHVVLSPGSRNAPLTLSFSRHPKLKIYSIVDERSAGFIALGIAQHSQTAVVLCCTSGTALLNYLPAIAEAYYQGIPLIVISADRPPEWIDQRDGQTINQSNVAANFVKGFFQMPVSLDHSDAIWEFQRKLNDVVNLSCGSTCGPVHVNIPFREPFYPAADQQLNYSKELQIIDRQPLKADPEISDEMRKQWNSCKKKLIVVGQGAPDPAFKKALFTQATKLKIPVVTDIISNMDDQAFIRYQDHFLPSQENKQAETLKPDLLITCGKSIISKNLKLFLRKNKPKFHWHFEEIDQVSDTFQSLSLHLPYPFGSFLNKMDQLDSERNAFDDQLQMNYMHAWKLLDEKTKEKLEVINQVDFSEYKASAVVSSAIPKDYTLHLANSMPVRYANLLRLTHSDISVYCNRGTSGIDGTNGTAVGHAMSTDNGVVLWTGDLSLFYDRNAFFHQHDTPNLKIIVMNNQGGGIFRLIKGPKALPELERYFETRHHHTARYLADEFGFEYFSAADEKTLQQGLDMLFSKAGKKILEVFTEPSKNEEVYNKIKNISYE
ncbi:MAG: 2-succinyl-5-enolpyruvyl-6-hydroxy-3-cyclohexene-1-carboxylic-acid synthase [Cyclobacteriaceae bacterium]|jgi:2-succinyl-5-enolpyruvyl-6-hydroxy-3-cyclohexene-1-carboxylate synthase